MTFHNFTEAVARRCFIKKVFLEILQDSQENTCARFSFLLKLKASGLQLYQKRDNFIKKETLAQVFSLNFAKFLRTPFSYRTPPVAASDFRQVIYTYDKRFWPQGSTFVDSTQISCWARFHLVISDYLPAIIQESLNPFQDLLISTV